MGVINDFRWRTTETIQGYLDRLGWSDSAKSVNEYVDHLNANQDTGFYVQKLARWPTEGGRVIEARTIWRDTWLVNDGMKGRGPSFEYVKPYLDSAAECYKWRRFPADDWIKCEGPARELTVEEHVALVNLLRPNSLPITNPVPQSSVFTTIFSAFKRAFSQ